METDRIFVDTNIIIYLTQGDENVVEIIQNKDVYTSFVTEIELLSFNFLTENEQLTITKLLNDFKIVEYHSSLKNIIIDLRKKYNLKFADSVILASAIFLNIPFVTSDKKLKNVTETDIILYEL